MRIIHTDRLLIEEIQAAIAEKIEDRNSRVYAKRSELELKKGNYSNAIFEIDKAIEFSDNPSDKRSYINKKLEILDSTGNHKKSIHYINSNIDYFISDSDIIILKEMAERKNCENRYEEALEVINIIKDRNFSYYNLELIIIEVDCYKNLKLFSKIEELYEYCILKGKEVDYCLECKIYDYINSDKLIHMTDYIGEVVKLSKSNRKAVERLIDKMFELGEKGNLYYKTCIELIDILQNYNEKAYRRYFKLKGISSYKLKQINKAIEYFEECIEDNTSVPECIDYLVDCYIDINKIDDLVEYFDDLLSSDYILTETYGKNNIRNIILIKTSDIMYNKLKDYRSAIAYLKESLKIKKDGATYFQIGLMYECLSKESNFIINSINASRNYKKAKKMGYGKVPSISFNRELVYNIYRGIITLAVCSILMFVGWELNSSGILPYFTSKISSAVNSNKDEYIMYDSNSRYLSKEELENFTKEDLSIMRNEIFARKGYVFQKEPFKSHFESKSWYVPDSSVTDDNFTLNEFEEKNVTLIKKMEKSLGARKVETTKRTTNESVNTVEASQSIVNPNTVESYERAINTDKYYIIFNEAYTNIDQANKQIEKLKSLGIDSHVVDEDNYYKVRIGSSDYLEEARSIKNELMNNGSIDTYILVYDRFIEEKLSEVQNLLAASYTDEARDLLIGIINETNNVSGYERYLKISNQLVEYINSNY